MTSTYQPLFAPVQLTATVEGYYVAAARTRIEKLTIANPSASTAYTATVYWVPAGGTAGVDNALETTRTLLPLETWDIFSFIGHTLAVGDSIRAEASAPAVLNFFGSGLVMTP